MGKSVYSMVLTDEVISAVDRLAIKEGKSRSQMVDQILAEHIGFNTVAKRIEQIVLLSGRCLQAHQRLRVERTQQSVIDFLSAIEYKYSPRVRYSVELFPNGLNEGVLKISLRTTNDVLLELIAQFFTTLIAIEKKYRSGIEYFIDGGKLSRKLDFSSIDSLDQLAKALTDYVSSVDYLMNLFIANYNSGLAKTIVEAEYLSILPNAAL